MTNYPYVIVENNQIGLQYGVPDNHVPLEFVMSNNGVNMNNVRTSRTIRVFKTLDPKECALYTNWIPDHIFMKTQMNGETYFWMSSWLKNDVENATKPGYVPKYGPFEKNTINVLGFTTSKEVNDFIDS